ncbi:MAG: cell envelope integrity protein TolA, partial [Opitutaceae bacterium]|nr:cell envelope integrity protein TolA [Opitutaceae bacterium]
MTARSPSAFAASLGIHAMVVLLILLSAHFLSRNADDGPKIFTLVGGEGTNYSATQAPAAGEPGAAGAEQVKLPPIVTPVRQPEPAPLTPVSQPPDPAPLKVVEAPKAQPRVEPKPADFTKNIVRLSEKRKANIEKKFKADLAREARLQAERERKEAEARRSQMTKAEFDKANKAAKSTPSKSTASARIPSVADGVRRGMAGAARSSTQEGAGGTAQERADADMMSAYISMIVARIRQAMTEANFSAVLSVELQFSISSGGVITGTRILGGSGSSDFDHAVLDAFNAIPNLGPPPNGKGGTFSFRLSMR